MAVTGLAMLGFGEMWKRVECCMLGLTGHPNKNL